MTGAISWPAGAPAPAGGGGKVETAQEISALRDALDEMTTRHDEAARHLDYLLQRSVLERLLFGLDGRPYRLIRQVLFHKNGKPRGMFRGWLLTPAGRPRRPFEFWMSSPAYRRLPRALRLAPPGLTDDRHARAGSPAALSPRTARFVQLLEAARAVERQPS